MLTAREDLVATLEDLKRTVRSIEARVAALEARSTSNPEISAAEAAAVRAGSADRPVADAVDAAGLASLAGQGLLGLAGAYLLRALTEQGALPETWGYTVGAAWACAWLALAYRAGSRGASVRSAAFGAVACSVAYPLVWEASTRSHLVGAAGAALALAGMTGAALLVASSIRLQTLAWVVASFAVVTTFALLPGADRLVPATVFMIGLGIATLWLGYVRDWFALRWPVAALADLLVCWMVFSVPPGRGIEQPSTAVALGLLLAVAYLGSILVRTLWRARDVLPFEVVQGFAAIAVGIGGTLTLEGRSTVAVGAATLAFGAGCYLAAALAARQRGFAANFHFYTTLALALVLTGVTLMLVPARAALAFSTIALVAAAMSARRTLPVIALQAACYALAGALVSNQLTASVARLGGPAQWPGLSLGAIVVTCSAAGSLAMLSISHLTATMTARLARLLLLGIAALGLAASSIQICLPLVTTSAGVDGGALATVRTVVIAVAAVALGWLARTGVVTEALWTTSAVLVLGGMKLLLEDFTQSRPATLFLALAAYGGALIAAPRLARRRP